MVSRGRGAWGLRAPSCHVQHAPTPSAWRRESQCPARRQQTGSERSDSPLARKVQRHPTSLTLSCALNSDLGEVCAPSAAGPLCPRSREADFLLGQSSPLMDGAGGAVNRGPFPPGKGVQSSLRLRLRFPKGVPHGPAWRHPGRLSSSADPWGPIPTRVPVPWSPTGRGPDTGPSRTRGRLCGAAGPSAGRGLWCPGTGIGLLPGQALHWAPWGWTGRPTTAPTHGRCGDCDRAGETGRCRGGLKVGASQAPGSPRGGLSGGAPRRPCWDGEGHLASAPAKSLTGESAAGTWLESPGRVWPTAVAG